MKMLFEVMDLAVASPATVSRIGVIYMTPSNLGWMPYVQTWVSPLILRTLVDSLIACRRWDVHNQAFHSLVHSHPGLLLLLSSRYVCMAVQRRMLRCAPLAFYRPLFPSTKIPTDLPEAFPAAARQHLLHLFEGCVQKGLDFQRRRCKEPVSCVDIQLATSLSFIFQVGWCTFSDRCRGGGRDRGRETAGAESRGDDK